MFGACLYFPIPARRVPPFCPDQDDLPLDLSWKSRESRTPQTAAESAEDGGSSDTDTKPHEEPTSPAVRLNSIKEEKEEKMSDELEVHATASAAEMIPRKTRERSLLPCQVCGKAFDRPSLLKRHIRTHTGEKPHVCDVCGKGFSTSSSLNTHRRIHSGEKPHECPVCGKRFTASSNLYYHRMTHVKEKPHKCTMCNKSFPTPGDLKSHMYVHNGSWPFQCHVCQRGFSKQTNLRNHLFLHTGKKPHTCSQCGKSFALACNLRAHLRTHADVAQAQSSGRNEDKSAVNPSLTAAEASPSAVLAPSDSASSIFWQNFQQHLAKNILVNRVHHLGLLSSLNYSIQ